MARISGRRSAEQFQAQARGRTLRLIAVVLWLSVLGVAVAMAVGKPSTTNLTVLGVLGVLCAVVYAQAWLDRAFGHRRRRMATARVENAAYISEDVPLPNRNYLLSEIRREIARSRTQGLPFVLVHLSLPTFAQARERRGHEFADRALASAVALLRRVTRSTDFLAYLNDACFGVLLTECDDRGARAFLRRLPGNVAVSDGAQMLDLPLAARLLEYDLESVYASDLLRDTERSTPLAREPQRDFTTAA